MTIEFLCLPSDFFFYFYIHIFKLQADMKTSDLSPLRCNFIPCPSSWSVYINAAGSTLMFKSLAAPCATLAVSTDLFGCSSELLKNASVFEREDYEAVQDYYSSSPSLILKITDHAVFSERHTHTHTHSKGQIRTSPFTTHIAHRHVQTGFHTTKLSQLHTQPFVNTNMCK